MPTAGTVPATVVRLAGLGFEVKVDAVVGDDELRVHLTRGEADRPALVPGGEVHVRALGAGPAPARAG